MGVRTALSERWRRGEVSLVAFRTGLVLIVLLSHFLQLAIIPDSPTLETVSTRSLSSSLSTFPDVLSPATTTHPTPSKILFLLSSIDPNFALSARNMPNVKVELVDDIDVYPLLQGDRVVLDLEAVEVLDEWLGRQNVSHSAIAEDSDLDSHPVPSTEVSAN